MVGKRIASDYYVHRKYVNKIQKELFILYELAKLELSPEQEKSWNILKVNKREKRVSFLEYPKFDIDAHPELKHSISVNLSKSPPIIRITRGRGYILHRKELFIDKDYPLYAKFHELTKKEEEFGLLDAKIVFKGKKLGTLMGRKKIWEEWLSYNNIKILDHEIEVE
ncbi:MAG: hypothetical protein ACFFB5_13950 [Promethearchaeota archaeon]